MVTLSYLGPYDTLFQNVTGIITKCNSYFITKLGKNLLQNSSGLLSQNGTLLLRNYYKSDVYYTTRRYT